VQLTSINDDGRLTQSLKLIRSRGVTGLVEQKRWFVAGGLRCNHKQLQFQNGFAIQANSDAPNATATLNQSAKTLTASGFTWPVDPIDWEVALESDGYIQGFTVTNRTATVLTFTDPGGLLPVNGTYRWVLRGYSKSERFHLISASVIFGLITPTQKPFQGTGADTGAPQT
jgi:hypothetical protein